MAYEVALLVFGILLVLLGLIGKVKAKELEVGTSSRVARVVTAIIGFVLIIVSFAVNESALEFFFPDHPEQTTVPDVVNQRYETAESMLTGLGFVVTRLDYETNEHEDGTVISQSLAAGTEYSPGAGIMLTVAATTMIQVPDVVGSQYRQVVREIENLGLTVRRNYTESDTCRTGTVIAQSPTAGTKLPRGAELELTIARRPHREELLEEGEYTVQQLSNGRYVQAYESQDRDWAVVTRERQSGNSQTWYFRPVGNKTYTIQQKSSARYLDVDETANNTDLDFAAVTRGLQNDDTQHWILTDIGDDVFTIQQKSSRKYLEAYQDQARDYRLMVRPGQDNDTQKWIIKEL